MLFSGARPSLHRPREDRVFDTVDTTGHRTLFRHRLALQTG